MRKLVNRLNGQGTVRVGATFVLPGDMTIEVMALGEKTILVQSCYHREAGNWEIPLNVLCLEWRDQKEASELMTEDDWIHASNNAREDGGHFMGYLARAYQHADGSNRPPIKRAYHTHFFRFLSEDRRKYLQEVARQGLE
jgi:hypothetical protein